MRYSAYIFGVIIFFMPCVCMWGYFEINNDSKNPIWISLVQPATVSTTELDYVFRTFNPSKQDGALSVELKRQFWALNDALALSFSKVKRGKDAKNAKEQQLRGATRIIQVQPNESMMVAEVGVLKKNFFVSQKLNTDKRSGKPLAVYIWHNDPMVGDTEVRPITFLVLPKKHIVDRYDFIDKHKLVSKAYEELIFPVSSSVNRPKIYAFLQGKNIAVEWNNAELKPQTGSFFKRNSSVLGNDLKNNITANDMVQLTESNKGLLTTEGLTQAGYAPAHNFLLVNKEEAQRVPLMFLVFQTIKGPGNSELLDNSTLKTVFSLRGKEGEYRDNFIWLDTDLTRSTYILTWFDNEVGKDLKNSIRQNPEQFINNMLQGKRPEAEQFFVLYRLKKGKPTWVAFNYEKPRIKAYSLSSIMMPGKFEKIKPDDLNTNADIQMIDISKLSTITGM